MSIGEICLFIAQIDVEINFKLGLSEYQVDERTNKLRRKENSETDMRNKSNFEMKVIILILYVPNI